MLLDQIDLLSVTWMRTEAVLPADLVFRVKSHHLLLNENYRDKDGAGSTPFTSTSLKSHHQFQKNKTKL